MLTVLVPLVALLTGASDDAATKRMEEVNQTAVMAVQQQLVQVARERGVDMRTEEVSYVTLGTSFLVHGPPADAEKHSEEEFAKGVDVTVLYVGGHESRLVPQGFYVVRAILPLRSTEGQAQFIDASGKVVATSRLLVKTREQEIEYLPDPIDPGPAEIPNITSTHIYRNGKRYVDCAGWQPYRVLYYEVY